MYNRWRVSSEFVMTRICVPKTNETRKCRSSERRDKCRRGDCMGVSADARVDIKGKRDECLERGMYALQLYPMCDVAKTL